MSNTELKTQINEYLDQVDDNLLKAVYAMLNTYVEEQKEAVIGYDIAGKPIFASAAKAQYAKDIEEVEKGTYTTIKTLKEKSKQWLKPTK